MLFWRLNNMLEATVNMLRLEVGDTGHGSAGCQVAGMAMVLHLFKWLMVLHLFKFG